MNFEKIYLRGKFFLKKAESKGKNMFNQKEKASTSTIKT